MIDRIEKLQAEDWSLGTAFETKLSTDTLIAENKEESTN